MAAPPGGEAGASSGEEDDLDRLMAGYDAEATAAAAAAAAAECRPPPAKRRKATPAERAAAAAPLSADNRGAQLLAKMGYAGGGLGAGGAGRAEPVAAVSRPALLGLGAESKKAARRAEEDVRAAAAAAAAERGRGEGEARAAKDRAAFEAARSSAYAERAAAAHLRQAIAACDQLDERAGLSGSQVWQALAVRARAEAAARAAARALDAPPPPPPDPDEPTAAEAAWAAAPVEERLACVVGRLRARYFYCIHCGAAYAGADELESRCPGEAEDAH
jgi:hypothetical protein